MYWFSPTPLGTSWFSSGQRVTVHLIASLGHLRHFRVDEVPTYNAAIGVTRPKTTTPLMTRTPTHDVPDAQAASDVAGNFRQTFAGPDPTAWGPRSNAQQVAELARVAAELRHAVARFKIAWALR